MLSPSRKRFGAIFSTKLAGDLVDSLGIDEAKIAMQQLWNRFIGKMAMHGGKGEGERRSKRDLD